MNSNSNSHRSTHPQSHLPGTPGPSALSFTFPLPTPISPGISSTTAALNRQLSLSSPSSAANTPSPFSPSEQKVVSPSGFRTPPPRKAKRRHEGPIADDFFQGTNGDTYANFLEFMGSEHSEVLNSVSRLGLSLTGSPEQKLSKLFRRNNLNLKKEDAIYINLESAEHKNESATDAATIFLTEFLSDPANMACLKQAYDDKRKDVMKDCPDFVMLLDSFIDSDIRKNLKIMQPSPRQSKNKVVFDVDYASIIESIHTELRHYLQQLTTIGIAQRLRAKHEYILFETVINQLSADLLDISTFIEDQNNTENPNDKTIEVFNKINTCLKNFNREITTLSQLKQKKRNKREKNEKYPSCLSFLVTKTHGKKHCFLSISSPETNVELSEALAKYTGTKGEWTFDMLSTPSEDSQRLIMSALKKLSMPIPEDPYKECSEKAYVNLLVKLILQYGDAIQISSVCNMMFYPNLQNENVSINPNNQRLNINIENNNFSFELIPCCRSCYLNKPAVIAILGAALEFKRRADAVLESLLRSDEVKHTPSNNSSIANNSLSTPENGIEISPLDTSIHPLSASHKRVKGRRSLKAVFIKSPDPSSSSNSNSSPTQETDDSENNTEMKDSEQNRRNSR